MVKYQEMVIFFMILPLQGGAPVWNCVQLVNISTISLRLMNGGFIELVIITGGARPCGKSMEILVLV